MNVHHFPLDDPITKVSTIRILIFIMDQSTLSIRCEYTILGYSWNDLVMALYLWGTHCVINLDLVRFSSVRVVLYFPLGIPRHGSVTVNVEGWFIFVVF